MADVRRSADRFTTRGAGLRSRHSFSFGAFYDPANVGHAALVAHNEDRVAPGSGYDLHPHADVEVVTWVLEGSLVHTDSTGVSGQVVPGLAQLLSAGSGVLHSERNDAPGTAVATRFVQMWVRPDESGLRPSYAQGDVASLLVPGSLVPLVSGVPGLDAAVGLHTRGAALHVARLAPGQRVALPDAPHLHVFVTRGAVDLEDAGLLEEGDAVRFAGAGSRWVRAVDAAGAARPAAEVPAGLLAEPSAEVLVWQLP
ncbi:MAG: pirin family protein [Nocardioidaceae bacterium]